MKDETIRVGDLVVVIKGGCTNNHVGRIFIVDRIFSFENTWPCRVCRKHHGFGDRIRPANELGSYAASRLKKINPPAVDETVETSDEVTV